ncbi:NTP transferase domain-containing protein [Candidatus Pacearchaeota archaeon]|nr:NTP transferase domain-containing protein [Candidatus Pacearchaeota archaeon]
MDYKVCILAAGVGSRMGVLSENVHKAILPINFKGVISHIIEKFPEDIEIVVAIGHKKETIKNYLALAYPNRKITYVEVDRYLGPGTGPGYSLLQCKNHLQCPFIFFTSDTLVLEKIPSPNENWFGIAPIKETENYCTVKIKNNLVCQLADKIKTDNKFAFIGLAGIYDYADFFKSLETTKDLKAGEIQVSNGFNKLIEKKLIPIGFTWFDTGTIKNYQETNKSFSGGNIKFDFSKGDEFIYFVNGRVIKYFADKDVAKNRAKRAEHLEGLCPKIEAQKENFYSYKKIDGQVLYSVLNRQVVKDFLYWAKLNLWVKKNLTESEKKDFYKSCKNFYYSKTNSRLKKFYDKTGIEDDWSVINGVRVPPLKELLGKIDWNWISKGDASNFHGDLQFDNILVKRDNLSNLKKFVLIDWRQDFGGLIEYGDLYYDLSKLYGGVNLSYQLIKQGEFSFDMSGSSVYYNFYIKNDLLEAKQELEEFILKNDFDLKKIKIITALIFLNMSPLHHDPFNLMLYFLGKSKLYHALKETGVYN